MATDNSTPLIVTILLAIAAWGFTHAVDRFLQQPMIKLSENIVSDTQKSDIKLTFKNITPNINFADLHIVILGSTQENKFTKPKLSIVGIGWQPNSTLNAAMDGIDLKLEHFHPGWEFELSTTMTGEGTPRIQLKKSLVATTLQKSGIKTCMVENEILITTCLGAITFAYIVFWVFVIRKKQSPT